MINNVTLGQYLPGESVLHRADPRTKIITTFIIMIIVFAIKSAYGFIVTAILLISAAYASKLPLKYTIKGLKPLLLIIIITSAINIFTTPGRFRHLSKAAPTL